MKESWVEKRFGIAHNHAHHQPLTPIFPDPASTTTTTNTTVASRPTIQLQSGRGGTFTDPIRIHQPRNHQRSRSRAQIHPRYHNNDHHDHRHHITTTAAAAAIAAFVANSPCSFCAKAAVAVDAETTAFPPQDSHHWIFSNHRHHCPLPLPPQPLHLWGIQLMSRSSADVTGGESAAVMGDRERRNYRRRRAQVLRKGRAQALWERGIRGSRGSRGPGGGNLLLVRLLGRGGRLLL